MPVKAHGAQPENAFHRVENLQAFTRRPRTGDFLGGPVRAHCFAFYPSVPRVRRCYGLPPG